MNKKVSTLLTCGLMLGGSLLCSSAFAQGNLVGSKVSAADFESGSTYFIVSGASALIGMEDLDLVDQTTKIVAVSSSSLSDDVDALQAMSSIAYLCLSRAMEIEGDNPNLYKDRLLVLNSAYNSFKYTVMSVLAEEEATDGFASLMFQSRADIESRDAIWQMEIADMERYPIICSSFPYFAERKNFMMDKINLWLYITI